MPTKHCAHSTCNSDSRYNHRDFMKNVTFVPFVQPDVDLEKCKRWIQACRREGFSLKNVSKHTYICSKHFVGGAPSEEFPDPLPPGKENFQPRSRKKIEKRKLERCLPFQEKHQNVFEPEINNVMEQETDQISKPVAPFTKLGRCLVSQRRLLDSSTQTDENERSDFAMQTEVHKNDKSSQTCSKQWLSRILRHTVQRNKLLVHKDQGSWCYKRFENDPTKFKFLTGVSVTFFNALYNLLGEKSCESLKYHRNKKNGSLQATPTKRKYVGKLSAKDKLFMTLTRLRRGFTLDELSIYFNITKGAVSNIFFVWIQFLYFQLLPFKELMFVSREAQKKSMPPVFKSFKNIRIVLDCFEVGIQMSTNFRQQGNTYSAYKSCNTVKFLLGTSVNGAIMFISDGFEGSISDKDIFVQSGITNFLETGDLVMVDRGFNIEAELNALGAKISIPPYLKGRPRFTPQEEMLTKKIAKARIFVEHAVRRVKEFRIFSRGRLPLSMLPQVSQIGYIIAFLVNSENELVPP